MQVKNLAISWSKSLKIVPANNNHDQNHPSSLISRFHTMLITCNINMMSVTTKLVIKTTLVKSLQRHCGQLTDLALIKTSMDNPAEEIRFLEV